MIEVQSRPLLPQMVMGDRYRLEREVGRGGMAIVWLAWDLKLERDVAVKVLLGELSFALGPERFRREIETVTRLKHPNILPIEDFGETEGRLYYVMPFIAGETLHKLLERERQLAVPDAVRIGVEIANALDYAHSQGIVHRDIKPENVLLQDGHAVVADFGIARAITEGAGQKLTGTGITLGTPTYMSPEQAMADPGIDGRSDIYSLGCVLYEMLAGQPPFSGATAQAIIARHQMDEAPSLTIARGTIPEEVEDVVFRALEKLPVDRYKTAGELAADLQDILTQTGARPTKSGDRRKRTGQRRKSRRGTPRVPYIAIAAAAIVVVAGAAWAYAHFSGSRGAASRIGTDTDPNHIAVLYFEDRSEGKKLSSLADGLTESLIDELSAVKPLKVISRNGVAPFKGKQPPTDSVQRALKVGTIVEGSVDQSGDKLRLKVRLVDAATSQELDSKTIDRPRTDVFALQDALAKEVSEILRKSLGREIESIARRPSTSNAKAWEALQAAKQELAGVDTVLAAGGVAPAVKRLDVADTAFANVEAMDAKWVDPVVQRGWIAHRKVLLLGNAEPAQIPKLLDAASSHATRALALAPTNADALELRATVQLFRWLNNLAPDAAASSKLLTDAEADFRASVKANPLQATAWNGLSFLLNTKTQFSEAKLAAQSAYESDPYLKDVRKTIWRLFSNSRDLNNRVEAEKWCKIGQQRVPEDYRFTQCRLELLELQGQTPKPDSIWATYKEFVARSPANSKEFNTLKGGMLAALALVRAGLPDSARAVALKSRGSPQVDPNSELMLYEAQLRAQLKDTDEVIRLLRRYFANNPQQRAFAKDDDSWWWDNVRDDARYKALVGGTG
jgi:serine/threonine protein kinase/tetratricopeptide (TPR) repeat protein